MNGLQLSDLLLFVAVTVRCVSIICTQLSFKDCAPEGALIFPEHQMTPNSPQLQMNNIWMIVCENLLKLFCWDYLQFMSETISFHFNA